MFYFICTYSFDSDRPVFGPYPTEEACWNAMKASAAKEMRIDIEENDYSCGMKEDQDGGEIILENYFQDRVDTTTWLLLEIDIKIPKETIQKAESVLVDNGIGKDEAPTVLQALGYVLLDAELYPDSNH